MRKSQANIGGTTFWRRRVFWYGVVIASVVLVAGVYVIRGYRYNEHQYEAGVMRMKIGVEAATKGLLGPMGGIERQQAIVTEGEKYINSFWCIDIACPTVETHWYLLANKDQ